MSAERWTQPGKWQLLLDRLSKRQQRGAFFTLPRPAHRPARALEYLLVHRRELRAQRIKGQLAFEMRAHRRTQFRIQAARNRTDRLTQSAGIVARPEHSHRPRSCERAK